MQRIFYVLFKNLSLHLAESFTLSFSHSSTRLSTYSLHLHALPLSPTCSLSPSLAPFYLHSLPLSLTRSCSPSLAPVLLHALPLSPTRSLSPSLAPFLPHSLPFSLKDSLLVWFYFCRREVYHTQRELLRERTRCKALEEELENPMNIHRWRKLEVSGFPCSNFSPLSSFFLLNCFFRLLFYIFFIVSSRSFLFLPSSLYISFLLFHSFFLLSLSPSFL